MLINIAIDGPSGSGKGITARKLSQKLNYKYLDTGAMYRAVALYLIERNIPFEDIKSTDQLKTIKITFDKENNVNLNGKNIEKLIRNQNLSIAASTCSTNYYIRKFLEEIQKRIVKSKGYIAEGRDIGSVIMPDAELKIYLTANVEIRAKRRLEDYKKQGIMYSLSEMIKLIEERDHQDSNREHSPLTKVKEAIEIDTTNLTVEDQVNLIYFYAMKIISKKLN